MINLMPSVRRYRQTITTIDGKIRTVTLDAVDKYEAKRRIAQAAKATWPGCSIEHINPEEVK